jgi:uroporphyrinogen decarboxylase
MTPSTSSADGLAAMPRAPLLVRAARREPVERTPVWFMRQAGRVLPEYRTLRARWTLVEMSTQPELAVEVTLQPLRRMRLDAAILFADIVTPLIGAGVPIDIVEGVGPVIASPVRDEAAALAIPVLEPERDVPHVLEALRLLRRALDPTQALIGFAGAPFTLAAYLIEGGPSRHFVRTKALMYGAPSVWRALMHRLTEMTIAYLHAQVGAGADAVQLFDSWVGALDPDDYARYVQPYTRRIFASLAPLDVPAIHFGVGTATLLPSLRGDGATVIGLDWRVPLDEGWATVGHHLAVQGNLDPAALFAPPDIMERKALDVLARAGTRPGHLFNLGHGFHPDTPLDAAIRLAEFVAERSAGIRAAAMPAAAVA